MKTKLFLLLTLLISSATYSQINLVQNPSFEDTVYCPFGTNQMDACANWLNFGNSPEYFNTCTGFGGPPINYNFGYQYANTGNALAGVILYARPSAPSGPNYREFIGAQLSSPLIIGVKYFISFYANCAAQIQVAIACNKVGLNFSTIQYDQFNRPPLTNSAHLFTDSILMDSVLWVRVSGSFIADSAYQFVGIGNYFDDSNTDTINFRPNAFQAYYYIDDVCVTTDSLYNETWTGLPNKDIYSDKFNIYPNPAKDKLYIEANSNFSELDVFDLQGKQLTRIYNLNLKDYSIDVSNLINGIYFIRLENKDSYSFQKFIINR